MNLNFLLLLIYHDYSWSFKVKDKLLIFIINNLKIDIKILIFVRNCNY